MKIKQAGRKSMANLAQVFGHNVRHHRLTVGLKQGSLAQLIGISTSMMSAIEKGTLPSMDVAVKLARYFKVPLSVLVDDMPGQGEEEPESLASDAVQIRVLQLFRDLAVAPADTRDLIADWIRELGRKLHSQGDELVEELLASERRSPVSRSEEEGL